VEVGILHFALGLQWRFLSVGSVSYIVGDVASGVGSGFGWSIGRSVSRSVSYRIGWSISCNIGSRIDWLYHFVFTSSIFSYRLKGTFAATSLARTF
jgi:hypothetical protein